MADVELRLSEIPVRFLVGHQGSARAEGNNAAWLCACGDPLPLVGRCYFQFGHECHTICPSCNRTFRVARDERKRAIGVDEIQP